MTNPLLFLERTNPMHRLPLQIMTLLLGFSASAAIAQSTTQPSRLEKDRQSILAMAGNYNVEFGFQETIGLKSDYKLHEPHNSHGTELVVVVTNEPTRIELQHLLVVHDSVVKHWRQEWVYENRDLLEFRGRNRWEHRTLTAEEAAGTWTQRVYNVDDGPRYEGYGKWEHGANWNAWESNETWRPLPRREYSTRSDYQVLLGRNRHLLTPTGWVHEQDNAKVVLDEAGKPTEVLAMERGLNTYDHVDAAEVKLAADYWAKTGAFWAQVRNEWSQLFASHRTLVLREKVDDKMMYVFLFDYLDKNAGEAVKPDQQRDAIRSIMNRFIAPQDSTAMAE
jgi:hypothetical protein